MNWKQSLAAWYITRRIVKATGLHGKEKKEMLELLKRLLGASWITTVLGWVAAALGVSAAGWTKPDGTINWMAVGLGILVAAFARMTKQSNVTGGSVPATLEAVNRIQTAAPATVMIMSTPKTPSATADAAAVKKTEK